MMFAVGASGMGAAIGIDGAVLAVELLGYNDPFALKMGARRQNPIVARSAIRPRQMWSPWIFSSHGDTRHNKLSHYDSSHKVS